MTTKLAKLAQAGDPAKAREIASAIAASEEEWRRDVRRHERRRKARYQDLLKKLPDRGLLPAEKVDYNKSYPGLFPAEVFYRSGSRRPGMKTEVEKLAEGSLDS